MSSQAWYAVSGRQVQAVILPVGVLPDNRMMDKVWPLSLWTTWRGNEGSLLWARGTRGHTRSSDTRTHTRALIPKGVSALASTYCQMHGLNRLAEGLRRISTAESRHFRPWCRLKLQLRFTVAVKPLSAFLPLSFNANGEPLWWKPFAWKCVCPL